jgi:hypothetical protein
MYSNPNHPNQRWITDLIGLTRSVTICHGHLLSRLVRVAFEARPLRLLTRHVAPR